MQLLATLLEKFPEHGPLLNELLEVLHFMGVDETVKEAFCQQVVIARGSKFWSEYLKVSARKFPDTEAKFKAITKFFKDSYPHSLRLCPAD